MIQVTLTLRSYSSAQNTQWKGCARLNAACGFQAKAGELINLDVLHILITLQTWVLWFNCNLYILKQQWEN